jgi:hypothetical protein
LETVLQTNKRTSSWINTFALAALALSAGLVVFANIDTSKSNLILNVSYDPTRELFKDINQEFIAKYQHDTGLKLNIQQSHGGSSRQSRAVIDGLKADVVTFALFPDVDALRKRGLIAQDWSKRLPHDSQPFVSTIVFVVRKGNPKNIHDWPDLAKPDVSIVTPSPKTSGNRKLSVLAAWGSVISRGGTEDQARQYLAHLYQHVTVLDAGSRGATDTLPTRRSAMFTSPGRTRLCSKRRHPAANYKSFIHPSASAPSPRLPGLTPTSLAHAKKRSRKHTFSSCSQIRHRKSSLVMAIGPLMPKFFIATPTACRPSICFR